MWVNVGHSRPVDPIYRWGTEQVPEFPEKRGCEALPRRLGCTPFKWLVQ